MMNLESSSRKGSLEDEEAGPLLEEQILTSIQDLQRQLWEIKLQESQQVIEDLEAPTEGTDVPSGDRVLIVSNRLPLSGDKDPLTGAWKFKMSSGGLVTALKGAREKMKFIWVGWLGKEVEESNQEEVRKILLEQYDCVPVFLSDELVSLYYNGFSNGVLWPLFHYVPLPMYTPESEKKFDYGMWQGYLEANRLFADTIVKLCHPRSRKTYIWVHDYHLMCLPTELRQRVPHCHIGWFLHTPFPSSEVYRVLPTKVELLEGVLSADLVGFHTYEYARHFVSACSRVLEVEASPRGIEYRNHFTALGVYPIGIDPVHIQDVLSKEGTIRRIKELVETYKGRKILLGVDRLDYIKGMPHKLLGLELFFQKYPEWQGKVTLIQIGIPSRTDVEEYQTLADQVNHLVGRINSTYGTLEYNPVHYINQSVNQEELIAIYNMADVCMVTSVRDGMNLVCLEYIAAQKDTTWTAREGPGVLVLSEFAGSAQSLSGAIRINPWNSEEVCASIYQAISLSHTDRALRYHMLSHYANTHTAAFWARSFMSDMFEVCANKLQLCTTPALPHNLVVNAYRRSKNRLIIMDYDGTIAPLKSIPQLAAPTVFIKRILSMLTLDPANTVLICSAREKCFVESWFGKLRVALAAEHGFYYRLPDETEFQCIAPELDLSWKEIILPIMTYFSDRTPGTYIEVKQSSLAWHYRDADPHFGAWQAKDMQINMEDVLGNMPLTIIQSRGMVEVRHQCTSKGRIVELLLNYLYLQRLKNKDGSAKECPTTSEVDFILCAGGERSDEELFESIGKLKEALKSDNPRQGETIFADNLVSNIPKLTLVDDELVQVWPKNEKCLGRDTDLCQERLVSTSSEIFTVHVGSGYSNAEYKLNNGTELRSLLQAFQV